THNRHLSRRRRGKVPAAERSEAEGRAVAPTNNTSSAGGASEAGRETTVDPLRSCGPRPLGTSCHSPTPLTAPWGRNPLRDPTPHGSSLCSGEQTRGYRQGDDRSLFGAGRRPRLPVGATG